MKNWSPLFILFAVIIIHSCSKKSEFRIEHQRTTLDEHISHEYPVISGSYPDSVLLPANRALRKMTELEYDLGNNIRSDSLYSGYKLLFENDSLLSLEFIKLSFVDGQVYTTYFPRVMHKTDLTFFIAPEAIWPDFARELLPNYFDTSRVKSFNENSYSRGSHSIISFALTQDSIIIYPGEEGEFRGRYRVPIPLNTLGLDSR
jgi:hypothetical protein